MWRDSGQRVGRRGRWCHCRLLNDLLQSCDLARLCSNGMCHSTAPPSTDRSVGGVDGHSLACNNYASHVVTRPNRWAEPVVSCQMGLMDAGFVRWHPTATHCRVSTLQPLCVDALRYVLRSDCRKMCSHQLLILRILACHNSCISLPNWPSVSSDDWWSVHASSVSDTDYCSFHYWLDH